jgi:DNA-binding MarR family transcriptional regulator
MNMTIDIYQLAADHGDMSLGQIAIMRAIADGHMTVRGAAEFLGIPRPTVTRTVDKLLVLKWATRAQDHQDRRSVNLRITKAGEKFLGRFQ